LGFYPDIDLSIAKSVKRFWGPWRFGWLEVHDTGPQSIAPRLRQALVLFDKIVVPIPMPN
jgi:hypothetical protein